MAAYLIARSSVTNPEIMKQYAEKSGPLARKYGAEYVLRTDKVEVLEGDNDGGRLIVVRFPDVASIHAFWNSAEYQELRKLRRSAAEIDVWIAEDETK
jgi:uncharacterized protein (DUF1330 family)